MLDQRVVVATNSQALITVGAALMGRGGYSAMKRFMIEMGNPYQSVT
jgi:hypothetical protein